MPITVKDTDNRLGVIIHAAGILTSEEYLKAMLDHLNQPAVKLAQYIYSLADYTEVTELKLKTSDVRTIAYKCNAVSKVAPDVIVANVGSNELFHSLANMWGALIAENNWTTTNVHKISQAKDWIRYQVEKRFHITDLTFE